MTPIPYIQVDSLKKSVGDKVLFHDVSFTLGQGERVALVARNGVGKSTLLDIIAGSGESDSGSIVTRSGLTIGYLPQQPAMPLQLSIGDYIESRRPELHVDRYELQARRILTRLGLPDFDRRLGELSGGGLKRVALAQVLALETDVLILDEPTNHLDLSMVEWLEDFLTQSGITLLMVTHDRYFLDDVCTRILEIDNQVMYAYQGNYSYYLDRREQRIEVMNAETERYRNLYRTELEWIRRMPQARGHKAQYRVDRFEQIEQRAKQQIQSEQVRLDVKANYIGSKIFEAKHVSKSFQDGKLRILDDFSYVFSRYEKLGIIGDNGTGKSTFIKLLLGLEPVDSGHFSIGQTVRFGYFSQTQLVADEGKRVIDLVRDKAEYIELGGGKKLSASQFLQHFLFSPQQQYDYVEKLSGGERQRLHLCMVLLENPNFLILDEPTNDLDIPTLNILEQYLRDFKGCLIVVSHDRYFMDKVVDHLFVFRGDAVIDDFPGNYTQYRESRKSRLVASSASQSEAKSASQSASSKPRLSDGERPRKLSYKEKQEMASLEEEMPLLESEKSQLEQQLSGQMLSSEQVVALSERYEQVCRQLDEKEMRWLELSEV